jgi:hypothetical protein
MPPQYWKRRRGGKRTHRGHIIRKVYIICILRIFRQGKKSVQCL